MGIWGAAIGRPTAGPPPAWGAGAKVATGAAEERASEPWMMRVNSLGPELRPGFRPDEESGAPGLKKGAGTVPGTVPGAGFAPGWRLCISSVNSPARGGPGVGWGGAGGGGANGVLGACLAPGWRLCMSSVNSPGRAGPGGGGEAWGAKELLNSGARGRAGCGSANPGGKLVSCGGLGAGLSRGGVADAWKRAVNSPGWGSGERTGWRAWGAGVGENAGASGAGGKAAAAGVTGAG